MRAHAAVAVLLLLTACTDPTSVCTEIGASPGVSVTVEKALATSLTGLALRVCWDGACKDYDVDLSPGSDTVDQGCDGNEPDAACSATAVPNGTLVGFVTVPALPSVRCWSERYCARAIERLGWPRSRSRPPPPTRTGRSASRPPTRLR